MNLAELPDTHPCYVPGVGEVVRGHWTKAGVDRDNPRVEIRLERAA